MLFLPEEGEEQIFTSQTRILLTLESAEEKKEKETKHFQYIKISCLA